MLFDEPARSASLSFEIANAIGVMRIQTPDLALRSIFAAAKPGLGASTFQAASAACPAIWLGKWTDLSIVLVDGVTMVEQATGYTDALNDRIKYTVFAGANPWLVRGARIVFNLAAAAGMLDNIRLVMGGHSMGGAIVQVLGLMNNIETNFVAQSIITYGSPRPGPDTFARAISGLDLARWMNTLDPVPTIFPRQNQAPLWFALLSQTARTNANRYVQPAGGIVLHEGGSANDADVPPNVTSDVQLNIATWILNAALNIPTEHSIGSYASRLHSRAINFPVQQPPVMGSTHSGRPVVASSREQQLQADQTLRQLSDLTREGSAGPTVIPEADSFTWLKLGGVWVVQFRRQTFAVGPTRKRVSHLANLGNQFLHRLQTEGRVDPDSLVDALRSYLADASDDTSQFRPTMKT